jgi:hypothetical protein
LDATARSVVQAILFRFWCRDEADVCLGYFSGMLGVYRLTNNFDLTPLVEYGIAFHLHHVPSVVAMVPQIPLLWVILASV